MVLQRRNKKHSTMMLCLFRPDTATTQNTFFSLLKDFNALLNHFLGMFADNITYHHIFELPHSVCDQQDICSHKNLLY